MNRTIDISQKYIDRFWSYVIKDSGVFSLVNGKYSECWLYDGVDNGKGYGQFQMYKEKVLAHIFSYMLKHQRTRRPRRNVLHHCDVRMCVRPSHLWLGSNQDNIDDKVSKNRQWRPKGVANVNSRLDANKVRAIRLLCNSHEHSHSEIGRKFGVSPTAIYNVMGHHTWKHVV